MLLGDISQAMTATLDAGDAVQRLAELIVPPLADWCLVSVVENGVRRDVGRAHRDPAMVPDMHRYADLRARTNQATAPVPTALRDGRPVVIQGIAPQQVAAMTTPRPGRRWSRCGCTRWRRSR
ncbi:hypothetical protein A7K94_0220930 [Modestobacter sp. VKM Ac-2676]|nr:hypothetical protein A7K94_0220930 [Modestobacter sp. VKM Ac-2676]